MTTILIHENTLYADRRHIRAGNPVSSFIAKKIFISADKQFAYGTTGRCIEEGEHATYENILRLCLQKAMVIGTVDEIDTSSVLDDEDREKLTKYGSWMVLTKTRSYAIYSSKTLNVTGITNAMGTGKWFCCGMIAAGLSPEKALASLEDFDPHTGDGFDKITVKQLRNFVVKGESK